MPDAAAPKALPPVAVLLLKGSHLIQRPVDRLFRTRRRCVQVGKYVGRARVEGRGQLDGVQYPELVREFRCVNVGEGMFVGSSLRSRTSPGADARPPKLNCGAFGDSDVGM